ncbi:MAG: hypothetical protein WAL71_09470 [Terriglobales bacterium]
MRKCLEVLAAVAVLCALSWAQAPAQASPSDSSQAPAQTPAAAASQTPDAAPQAATPPASNQTAPETISIPTPIKPPAPYFPRTELFAGYSFAQAGFFNAGHWAQLSGWNVSFGINAASWIGVVVDASQFFGNTKIPAATPAPFPTCGSNPGFCPPGGVTFNANTREYNALFGLHFPYRKYERWTPFGELMFGHDGVRGTAKAEPPGGYVAEVSSGFAILAGGGADYRVSDRFAVRLKADYLESKTDFSAIGKAKQDNLRLSVGVVIRTVKKKRRRLEDETEVEP